MEQADPIQSLFDRAKAHRIPMSAICAKAEIAATTPSRWRRNKNGANLASVTKLHEALNEIIGQAA